MGLECAFPGCGPRSRGHVKACEHITRGRDVVCCDLDNDRDVDFADFLIFAQNFGRKG